MSLSPSVSFIGSGNLAWHLAPALDNAGFKVNEVFSPNRQHAVALTERLYEAEVIDSLDFSNSKSKIFIIAVSDDAIREVVQEIVLPEGAVLVHTSGSAPLDVLTFAATPDFGVFYPLQTFSKTRKIDFRELPVFVETSSPEAEKTLMPLAEAISGKVVKAATAERFAVHVAAVFASNFTNHLLTVAKGIMEKNKLDFLWLKPLIAETINKSLTMDPEQAQTGPARRGDLEILDLHMDFLKEDEVAALIYRHISQSIIDQYQPG